MAVNDITTNFQWNLPDVGGDIGIWGGLLRSILGEDGVSSVDPLGIDAVVGNVQATADAALPKAGGTLTGGLTIAPSGESLLTLNRGADTNNADIVYSSLGSQRARAGITNTPDADYRVRIFDDSGVGTTVLAIDRATHAVSLSNDLAVAGDLTVTGALNISAFVGDGSGLTNLNAAELSSGIIPDARFPAIMDGPDRYEANAFGTQSAPAFTFAADPIGMYRSQEDVITFATAGVARVSITNLGINVLTSSGYFGPGHNIESLNASALTQGVAPAARIPDLDASKITSGSLDNGRLSGSYTNIDALTTSGLAEVQDLRVGNLGTAISRIQVFQVTISGFGSTPSGNIVQQNFVLPNVTASSRILATIKDNTAPIGFVLTEALPSAGAIQVSLFNARSIAQNPDGTVINILEIDLV